jgi:hypothetical protein
MKRNGVRKFDVVAHGPFTADIRLDKQTGEFSCEYAADRIKSTNLVEVRKWALEKLRGTSGLVWSPLMSVKFSVQDTKVNYLTNCSNLFCYIERCYVAWAVKKWVWAPWVVHPRGVFICSPHATSEMEQPFMSPQEIACERLASAKDFWAARDLGDRIDFPLVEPESMGSRTYWVPHTDERWATMIGIIEKMRELRQRIASMLESGTGWKQLEAISKSKLLTAPTTDGNHE